MVTTAIKPGALHAEEAAKYIGIARTTFDQLAKSVPLPGIRIGNRQVYRVETLDQYLRNREQQAIQRQDAS